MKQKIVSGVDIDGSLMSSMTAQAIPLRVTLMAAISLQASLNSMRPARLMILGLEEAAWELCLELPTRHPQMANSTALLF